MSTSLPSVEEPGRVVSVSVLAAALVGAFAVLPVVPMFASDHLTSSASAQLAAWPPLAFVGAVALDRRPASRVAWCCVALALVGWLLVVWGLADGSGRLTWRGLDASVSTLGPWPMVATLLLLGSLFLRPDGRLARRRRFWMILVVVVGTVATVVSWRFFPPQLVGVVPTVALWLTALTVGVLVMARDLRPVDEVLLDAGVVLGVVATAAAAGLLVWFGGQLAGLRSAAVSGLFAAVAASTLAALGARWVRAAFLARRYGTGTLSPADVADITADLHGEADPRELLGKAAALVAAASRSARARIIMGEDPPEAGDQWVEHPLVVGERRVGTLLIQSSHAEGPESRQRRVVAQLIPTISLVTRAVALAVEADHARRDASRERETERARILSDLHDDLGPVLAGMSMRVQAARRGQPEPWLDVLATELAACRADLRRIVSGLTPSALTEGDLEEALEGLIATFAESTGGPRVEILGSVPTDLSRAAAVTVYRTVAEGITNAARHARASAVTVTISSLDGTLRVEVTDDGVGGSIAPGVGLTSLRGRAEDLDGTLSVGPAPSGGTQLVLDIPGGTT